MGRGGEICSVWGGGGGTNREYWWRRLAGNIWGGGGGLYIFLNIRKLGGNPYYYTICTTHVLRDNVFTYLSFNTL